MNKKLKDENHEKCQVNGQLMDKLKRKVKTMHKNVTLPFLFNNFSVITIKYVVHAGVSQHSHFNSTKAIWFSFI